MRGVNKVILIGNATRDAELRPTQNEKPVSSIRLATNRTVKGEEETQFHTIVCWDRLAATTAEYVKKGDPLYVEGRRQFCAESTAYLQHRRHSGLEAGPPRGLLSDGRRSRLA